MAEVIGNIGGGGGGGGGASFPDTIITGSGSYTIPAGFNAVVNVISHLDAFTINGYPWFNPTPLIPIAFTVPGGAGSGGNANVTLYTNTGSTTALFIGGLIYNRSLQVGGGSATVYVGAWSSGALANGPDIPLPDLPVQPGQTIRIVANSMVLRLSGDVQEFDPTAVERDGKLSVPTGTVINGGSYVVELYAI